MPASKPASQGAAKPTRARAKTPRNKQAKLPSQDALRAALQRFGHDRFRPGQERIIHDLLRGRDVLAVLPTGAGKSLVYQLAAQFLDGVTLVVSPLIALMKDQVETINEQGVGASVINSTQGEAEAEDELDKVKQHETKLLYITPERFQDEDFLADLAGTPVGLFVVDEAHCVSEWGHSFRPAYLGLAGAAERLGRPTMLALTATATPWIRTEIIDRLGLRDPDLVVREIDRPNLFLEVRRLETEHEVRQTLHDLFLGDAEEYPEDLAGQLRAAMQGSGIVYTATTRAAQETADWLNGWSIPADYYHGQRKKADRDRVQDAFMAGDLRVIAATNAFGMGVDKPDVRFVVHCDIPGSLEAYYQEAGRAGRDGAFARCTLLYRPADLGQAAFLSGGGHLTPEDIEQARAGLRAQPEGTIEELAEATGLSAGDAARAVTLLRRAGIVEEKEGRVRLLVAGFDPATISLEDEESRRAYDRSRLDMMRGYAETDACRRRYILNYFGDDYPEEACGLCDNDVRRAGEAPVVVTKEAEVDLPFALGDRVVHASLGEGVVQRLTGAGITILFDKAGYKTLAADVVQDNGLLKPLE
jgi:ATP-dependent DNA helicase RecQ